MSTTATRKVPKSKVVMLELVDKRGSGFFLEGTQDTAYAQELNAPLAAWIPASGYRAVFEKDERTGEDVMVYEEIRYIENQQEIRKAVQDKMNIKANGKRDKIMFHKGFITIADEGNMRGLYEYLTTVFYNQDAPFRSDNADARYRVVDMSKNAEVLLEDDEMLERAIKITNSLKTKTGDKSNPWVYNEEKVEVLADLFQIVADNTASKVYALSKMAKTTPAYFVEKAETFVQKSINEVSEAMQYGVIFWDKNAAIIRETNSLITDFGTGKMKESDKINRLSEYLKMPEAESKIQEIRILVDAAKQKSLD